MPLFAFSPLSALPSLVIPDFSLLPRYFFAIIMFSVVLFPPRHAAAAPIYARRHAAIRRPRQLRHEDMMVFSMFITFRRCCFSSLIFVADIHDIALFSLFRV